jgi:hypothetical protein
MRTKIVLPLTGTTNVVPTVLFRMELSVILQTVQNVGNTQHDICDKHYINLETCACGAGRAKSVKAHSDALQGVTLRFTQGKLARLRAKAAMKTPDGGQRDESLRPPEVRESG